MTSEAFLDGRLSSVNSKKLSTYDGYLKKYDKYKQQSTFVDYSDDEERSSLTEDQRDAIRTKKQRHTRYYSYLKLKL